MLELTFTKGICGTVVVYICLASDFYLLMKEMMLSALHFSFHLFAFSIYYCSTCTLNTLPIRSSLILFRPWGKFIFWITQFLIQRAHWDQCFWKFPWLFLSIALSVLYSKSCEGFFLFNLFIYLFILSFFDRTKKNIRNAKKRRFLVLPRMRRKEFKCKTPNNNNTAY